MLGFLRQPNLRTFAVLRFMGRERRTYLYSHEIAMKWALVSLYFLSILHIHFRGKVRLPFMRQLFDHSSFMAPINWFMHVFSKLPSTPFLEKDGFKELAV